MLKIRQHWLHITYRSNFKHIFIHHPNGQTWRLTLLNNTIYRQHTFLNLHKCLSSLNTCYLRRVHISFIYLFLCCAIKIHKLCGNCDAWDSVQTIFLSYLIGRLATDQQFPRNMCSIDSLNSSASFQRCCASICRLGFWLIKRHRSLIDITP